MATLNNSIKYLSLMQAARLLAATGSNVTYLLRGEPGIGKTTMLKMLASQFAATHEPIYADAPVMDIPDVAMPWVDKDNNTSYYAPSSLWRMNSPKPKIVMVDEIGKAAGPTKLIFTRMLLEHTLGDNAFPAGTIVFATTNLSTDGVGDVMQAHINNRISTIYVRKPTAVEWCAWASEHGVNPMIIAWVHQNPQVLASYTDGNQNENPYIFNPKTNSGAFVSPRSLDKAGHIVDGRGVLTDDEVMAALDGCVGARASADMAAHFDLGDQLPSWGKVENDPTGVKMPTSVAAQFLLLFGSIQRVDTKNLNAHMKFIDRFPAEMGAVWMRSLAQMKSKAAFVLSNKEFTKRAVAIGDIL